MIETFNKAHQKFVQLVDALSDPTRRMRTLLAVVIAYAAIWTLYGVISKSSQDVNADMAELVVWSRDLAWGYPKHPPLLGWVPAVWFSIFPLADWAYTLLATLNCALGIWLATVLAGKWLEGPKVAAGRVLLAALSFLQFFGPEVRSELGAHSAMGVNDARVRALARPSPHRLGRAGWNCRRGRHAY